MTNQEAIEWLSQLSAGIEWEVDMHYAAAIDKAIVALKALDSLKDQIYMVKHSINSENSDYLTGYICALSAVEGMIAEVEQDG